MLHEKPAKSIMSTAHKWQRVAWIPLSVPAIEMSVSEWTRQQNHAYMYTHKQETEAGGHLRWPAGAGVRRPGMGRGCWRAVEAAVGRSYAAVTEQEPPYAAVERRLRPCL